MKNYNVLVNKFLLLALMLSLMSAASAQSISYQASFDLSTGLSFDDVYSVSGQEGAPLGMEFSPDGMRLFVVGQSDEVHQYTLTTAFDVTSSITYNGSYDLSTEDNTPVDITFTPDGMTMFMVGQSSRTVFEYTLSVAFDITSTVTKTANTFRMGFRAPSANALAFSSDGMLLWVADFNSIQQFPLLAAYDISTASTSRTNDELVVTLGNNERVYDFQFSGEGEQLYLLTGLSDFLIREYQLPGSFDILSGVTQTASFDPSSEELSSRTFSITPSGNRLHLLGFSGDDINQYDFNTPDFNESLANNGSTNESFRTVSLTDETFTKAGSSLTYGVDYTITNLPSGLVGVINVASDGKSGTLSFTGNATNHQFSDGVADLIFTFNNSSFVGGDASVVANATAANSGISISFRDNNGPFLIYDTYSDLRNANRKSTTLSVSGQETQPNAVAFSNDGTRAFVTGAVSGAVHQYNLTTPFDITSGATYSGHSYDVSGEELSPQGLTFNPTGTKMYVLGFNGEVNQYSLSTGFDLSSTVSFDGSPLDLSGDLSQGRGIAFNPEGSKMYITGYTGLVGAIYEYTLNTFYDVTASASLTTSAHTDFIFSDLAFDTDGNKLFGTFSNTIKEYSLSAPYSIATGLTLEQSHSTGILGSSGLSFNSDRSGFFVIGTTADAITQFDLGVDNFEESFTNDGSISSKKTIKIVDGFFANAGGTLTSGIHFTATGVPTGLTPVLSVAMDGLSAELSLTGNATNHTNASNSDDIIFTFNDVAFNGNTAAEVANAINASSHYPVSFTDPNPVLFINSAFDITDQLNLVPGSFSLRPNSSHPFNPTFSSDGTRLFVVDQANDAIDQYNVTVPFETKQGMVIAGTYSVTSEETIPNAVQFSGDGTKMFVMGTGSDRVHQYSLATPFDIISGVSYDNISFNVSAFEADPYGLTFSPTGQRMYIIGQDEGMILQFKLPKAFDLSATPVYLGAYDQSLEFQPTALYITPNGDRMQLIGTNRDRVFQLNLTEKFDVTSAVYSNQFLSVTSTANTPSGITFSPSGNQMYVTGSNFDRIGQFNLVLDSDFTETAGNQGEVEGSFSFGLTGDKFSNAGSSLTYPTHFTVTNLPPGLTPIMTISADGAEAILTLSGAASNHQNANDVEAFEVTFLDGAFVSGNASVVTNAAFSVDASIDFNNNPALTFVNGYNDDSEITFNDSFYIGNNESQPTGIAFSNDGLTMFVVGTNGNEVNQYALNEPFNINGGVSFSGILNLGGSTAPTGIFFNPTGTKLFIIGFGLDRIYQYTLTTPFHVISGASLEGTADVDTEDLIPQGMAISRDGDKLFMIGNSNDAVFQYSLGSNFDISGGITYDNVSFSIAGQDISPADIHFSPDGTKMYISGALSDEIHQYNLSTPYDVSSGVTYSGVILNFSEHESVPGGFTFGKDGSRIFVVGTSSQAINQFELTPDGFKEKILNNGEVDGLQGIQLFGDTFVNAGGSLTSGTHYTITGIPSDLTPSISVNAEGDFATLTLSGQATDNQNADDIANLEISFLDEAFLVNDAAGIFNSTNQMIAGIDFNDNNPRLTYGDLYDLEQLTFAGNSNKWDTEDVDMRGIAFSSDGTKLFLGGVTNDRIYQYNLTDPFDVSAGISYSGVSLDITATGENFLSSLTFNNDGTRLFVIGFLQDEVHQYNLTNAFDLSVGVSYTGSFNVASQEDGPSGMTFNNDGTKMYIVGSGDEVNQYSLATPFEVTSGVTFDGSPFYTGDLISTSNGISFSPSGLDMFILDSNQDRIQHYRLERPFDITSDVTHQSGLLVRDQDTGPLNMVFSSDHTRLFLLASSDDDINQYDFRLDSFVEGSRNDGSVDGEQNISILDDQFANTGGTLSSGTHFSINNLPSGLTPILSINAEGTSAVLTFDGKAVNHQNVHDLSGLQFTFTDAAFEGGNASAVANASSHESPFDIDFRDNNPAISYGNTLDLSHATLDPNNYDMSAQDSPGGLAISADGTVIFLCGEGGSSIYQYTLATPYDISTGITYNGFFDASSQDFTIHEVQFSGDGMRMFALGHDNYSIYQYNLTTPFDITTGVTYSGNSFSFRDYGTDIYALAFNSDGSKMYFASTQRFEVIQLSLASSYDLSSVSDDGNPLDIEAIGSPMGMAFSTDGRYLLMAEDEDDYSVVRYTLNAPFDVTAGGSFDGVFFDLNTPNIWGTGIAIKPDGSKFFVADGDNGLIHQVDIDLGGFAESTGNDGSLEGELNITIFDESFTNAGGTLVHGTDYTINNLPSGLSPLLNVDAEGYSANLTFSGLADLHGNAQDISGLVFTFNNSAFGNGDAGAVANAASHDSEIGIDFAPYSENDITSFTFSEIDGSATINDVEATVDAEAVAGTDVSAIIPTIGVSPNASITPNTGIAQDFTSAVTYTVTAEDGSTKDWDITITEALAAPTDISLSSTSFNENETVAIGTFTTADESLNDVHSYSFFEDGTETNNSRFEIVGAEIFPKEAFDFELENSEGGITYLIQVQSDDGFGGTFEKQFTLTLNDVNEAPTNMMLSNNTIDESNPIGTVVGVFSTTDEDAGQSHTYSLVSGPADAHNASFTIVGNQLLSAEVFDYETQGLYSIRVRTDDGNGGTFESGFGLMVNDLPTSITSVTLDNNTVDENEASGTLVGSLSTFGEDLSGSYTYTFATGVGDDDNGSFAIVNTDELVTNSTFDFETKSSYTVRIMTDDGNLSESFALTIDINDVNEAPTDISLSMSTITENNSIDQVIGTLTTDDVDAGQSFTYSLASGAGDTDNASFDILGNELQTIEVFDFETKSSYSIRVETNDGNGGTFQKAFNISILDENESIVIISPIADQNLDEGFGTLDIDLNTVFEDQDGDALTYEVLSSNTGVVTVGESSGTLTITEVGGFGSSTITVTADDGSGVTNSDEFIVTVVDVNEAPIIANSLADQSLEERFGSTQVSYTGVFSDGDGDVLDISVQSSNQSVVTVAIIAGEVIEITEVGVGTSTITLTADDNRGGIVSEEFTFTVIEVPLGFEDEISLEVYPNPTTSTLNVKSNEVLEIDLSDLNGRRLKAATGKAIQMDLRDLSSGVYLLKITNKKSTTTRRIIKAN